MEDEEFEWANVARPVKEKEEESPVCDIDDEGCLTCGS
jgi:hypothetical protein